MIAIAFQQQGGFDWGLVVAAVLTLVGTLVTVHLTTRRNSQTLELGHQSSERTKRMELESSERIRAAELQHERALALSEKRHATYVQVLKDARRAMEYWRAVADAGEQVAHDIESSMWLAQDAEEMEKKDEILGYQDPPAMVAKVLPILQEFNQRRSADQPTPGKHETALQDIRAEMELVASKDVIAAAHAFYQTLGECERYYVRLQEIYGRHREDMRLASVASLIAVTDGATFSEDAGFVAVEKAHVSLRERMQEDLNVS